MGRAFLLAGSRSVVVSLWSVDSLATERLMVQFYQNLRDGREPASALREAKLTVRGGVRLDAADPAVRGLFVDKGQDTPNTPPGTNSDASPQASEANTATQPKRHPFFFGAFVLFGR